MSESKKYDCFRGCEVVDCEDGTTEVTYREGCCKLPVHNYLREISSLEYADVFEVRFKNTRKGYYKNESGQSVRQGDKVVVEAASGYDLGFVSLEGPLVVKQMQRRRIDPASYEFKKIYRKARPSDIEKWMAATAREQATMIEARRIAATMGLDMKIGDVEFQGDGNKAIFYYIADARVDFRKLIKVLAETFHVRIEMKQIGARQEAGRIGGIGPCGRELCCATWMKNFSSVSTAAARFQDITPNPQKLAGQCAKLKCCLNYEVDAYMEAARKLPERNVQLETADSTYYYFKADTLAGLVTYSTDRRLAANLVTITTDRVREVMAMNQAGEKPLKLEAEDAPAPVQPLDLAQQEDLTRFDKVKRSGKRGNRRRGEASQEERREKQGRREERAAKQPKEQGREGGKGNGGGHRREQRPPRGGHRSQKGGGGGKERPEGNKQ